LNASFARLATSAFCCDTCRYVRGFDGIIADRVKLDTGNLAIADVPDRAAVQRDLVGSALSPSEVAHEQKNAIAEVDCFLGL
jgi:hypothetical protein